MTTEWTAHSISALAPDPASLKAGEKLATHTQWQLLAHNDSVVWGAIKGSGSNPYQTMMALAEPAFKCSCPSRKFPCKHGIALALIYVTQRNTFQAIAPPDWVQEWLDKRQERLQKQIEAATKTQPSDEITLQKRAAAQQKRNQAREDKITAGVAELQRWLADLIRQGLGQIDPSQWERMATRMIDAQAPGLARRLTEGANRVYRGGHWQAPLLAHMGQLHLLLEAWQTREQLSPELLADLHTQIGFTLSKEELLTQTGMTDHWLVMGQALEEDGPIRTQRTWLYGLTTQRYALLLDFAPVKSALPLYPAIGQCLQAEVVYYPSATPLRALIKTFTQDTPPPYLELPSAAINTALQAFSDALACNPWLESYPLYLQSITPVLQHTQWLGVDSTQHYLTLQISNRNAQTLLAESGGYALNLFGEWQHGQFQPLSAWDNTQLVWSAERAGQA